MIEMLFGAGGPLALWLQEGGQEISFTLWDMLRRMGGVALATVIILAIMSMYSIAVTIERWLSFNAAKKQSREFAPKVANALRTGKIDEAISISDKFKKSHLAMVVNSGLQEFQAHKLSKEIPGEIIDSAKRALQRAIAVKTAEFKRGLSALATIGSTAPFVGLFGTVVGIVNSFQGLKLAESAGIGAVAGGIAEALVATAFGIFVALPAVWMFNYFTSRVDSFVVEMENSSSELIDYFLKKRGE
ncbi:MAG: MotA/TolQ/ExbB proton channel family protein [Acidobacteriota bacterium]|nr:MotA/TolQ/ExbB proton channel family protein [Blastocatellia bacterium]MDW8238982.1 MotA/TolQ/ExbB proton channel family protein [Acidobacteriota bacterium]